MVLGVDEIGGKTLRLLSFCSQFLKRLNESKKKKKSQAGEGKVGGWSRKPQWKATVPSSTFLLFFFFFFPSPDFTSDSLALDISPSLSDTLAGLIGCQRWRGGRGDQRRREVKRMKRIQSIRNLHPNLVDVLGWRRRQPRSNFLGTHWI